MAGNNIGQVGATYHKIRTHTGVSGETASLLAARTEESTFQSGSATRGYSPPGKRRCRESATARVSPWHLLPLLRGEKEIARFPADTGSSALQQTPKNYDFQDGNTAGSATATFGGRLLYHSGSVRRILPCPHPQQPQEVPSFQGTEQIIPIQGAPLWTHFGTKSVHKSSGTSGRLPTPRRLADLPLSGRLAHCGRHGSSDRSSHRPLPEDVAGAGLCHQPGEVFTPTSTYVPVPGYVSGLHPGHGQAIGRPDPLPSKRSGISPTVRPSLCTDSEILYRKNVLMYLRGASRKTQNAPPSGDGGGSVGPGIRPVGRSDTGHPSCKRTHAMVDAGSQPQGWHALSAQRTRTGSDDGRVDARMGRPPGASPNPRALVRRRSTSPYQRTGTESYPSGTEELSPVGQWPHSEDLDRQHHGHVLHPERGRHEICLPLLHRPGALGMGPGKRRIVTGEPHSRGPQRGSRRPEQALRGVSRMGTVTGSGRVHLPMLGPTVDGSVCNSPVSQVSAVCLKIRRSGVRGECAADRLAYGHAPVRISPDSSDPSDSAADSPVQDEDHPHCPGVGTSDLVHGPMAAVSVTANPAPECPSAAPPRGRQHVAPGPGAAELTRLAPERLEFGHLDIGDDCMEILGAARAPSTRKTYDQKWKRFCSWALDQNIHPVLCEPQDVLPYLLALAESGLQHSSIRIHLAALTRHRRRPGVPSLFTTPVVAQFLKGLLRSFPPVRRPTPMWELNVVLAALMKPPFEPLGTTDLRFLSLKAAFLVAITSARRVSELQALSVLPPFLSFHKDKVTLRTHPQFIPKVVSDFHLNSNIVLPVFFPEAASPAEKTLHTLDVRRTLKFYVNRTAGFRKSDQLFVAFGGPSKGSGISKQGLARWIVACIKTAYSRARRPLPGRVTAHSTRGKAATTAFLANVPLLEICRAATWQSTHVFTKHYCVDKAARGDAAVGQAALKNLFR